MCLQVCAWEVSGETETFPKSARLRNIIDASIQYGDSLHVDLQEQLDANENL